MPNPEKKPTPAGVGFSFAFRKVKLLRLHVSVDAWEQKGVPVV
jgi:hypothetical protein